MRIYQILFSVFFIFLFSSCIYMPPGRGGEYTYAPKVYYSKGKYDATYDFVKETFVEPAKVNNIKTSVVDSTRKDNRTEKIEYEADKTIKVTIFKKDSILYSTSYYSVYDTSDFRNNIACGEHITFYEDGKAQLVENFNRNGKLDGDF